MGNNGISLEYGKFYHIYNRGINSCNLFYDSENYEYFLHLYDKYISPVAETFAWVLMKNHFHFLIRIKREDEITFPENLRGFKNLEGLVRINKQFSNLFNAYTKAINKRFHRTGSLFEHPFKRIKIETNDQLRYLVYYIHHNPIHHGFCDHYLDYPWSSYFTMVSPKQTKLIRSEVLNWYTDKSNYIRYHSNAEIERLSNLNIDIPHELI